MEPMGTCAVGFRLREMSLRRPEFSILNIGFRWKTCSLSWPA
jgi:hypothetical protein